MFMSLFVPVIPPMQEVVAAPPAIIQTAANTVKPSMVFDGECNVVQTPDNTNEWSGGFYPASVVGTYFSNVQHVEVDTAKAKIIILQEPKHGKLTDTGRVGDGPYFEYRAVSGYLGTDDATLLIEIAGKSYKAHVKFYVVEQVGDNGYSAGSGAATCEQSQPKRIATLTFNQGHQLGVVERHAGKSMGVSLDRFSNSIMKSIRLVSIAPVNN